MMLLSQQILRRWLLLLTLLKRLFEKLKRRPRRLMILSWRRQTRQTTQRFLIYQTWWIFDGSDQKFDFYPITIIEGT